jgi:hypothetical protein
VVGWYLGTLIRFPNWVRFPNVATIIMLTNADAVKEFERRKQKFLDYVATPEYQAKIIQRLQINDACKSKAEARQLTWELCARPDNPVEGCLFFIKNFAYTFDPRPYASPNNLPFIPFEYQEEAVKWLMDHIDNGRDGFIEKSRDMGISWTIFVWVPIWYWLFRDGVNILVGSYKEDLVDNRTKDSLFGMIDYAVDSLPKWILPKGFKKEKHRTHMKLVNPANSNLITGDTMNPDFGRGTRKTVILFDELGSWDWAKDAWESAGDSTACRIANSTPKGYNFYAMLRETGIDILSLHWKRHPMKDMDWYSYECSRRTPEEIAQELDISYNKSQEGRVYPEWNEDNVEIGLFDYDDTLPLYVGWDFGYTDDTAIIWAQKSGHKLRIIDVYRNNGKTIDFYVPFVTGIVPSENYRYTKTDLECIQKHRDWKRGTHFGDPAGRFSNAVVNTTVLDVLRNNGIIVNFKDSWKEFQKRKTAAKLLIRDGIKMNKNDRTKYFNNCMEQASYPKVKNSGVEEVRSMKPKHDYTSHFRSSFEYLALGLDELSNRTMTPYDKFKKIENNNFQKKRRVIGY